MKKVMVSILTLGIIAFAATSFYGIWIVPDNKRHLIIGSKDFTENNVLAHLMSEIIKANTELSVDTKVNLGGSNIAIKAIERMEIDAYPEYTGTILYSLHQQKDVPSNLQEDRIRDILEAANLEFTTPFGFNNTYALAVSKQNAEKHGLKTVSDLKDISSSLILACDFEFRDRPDGCLGLIQKYDLCFKSIKGMNRGVMYRSIKEENIDVIVAYTTDSQVKINNLVLLQDDKHYFPSYEAGALFNRDSLIRYPEIRTALKQLEGKISDEEMRVLNMRIEYEGLKAKTVAQDFLKEKGLLR